MENTKIEKKVTIALGSLQVFIGLGALAGGFGLVADPSGDSMGLPISFLDGSPFDDFLIPGIFLLTVNGIGTMIGAGLTFFRRRFAQEIAIVLGSILVAWIVIQVSIIRSLSWMHYLYFILGLLELGLGLYLRRHRTRLIK
jgi:uncharacterized membrane protein